MKSLFYSWDINIDSAYIITLKGNETSEYFSNRCQKSCTSVGMPYKVWYGYDGTKEEIIPPDHLEHDSFMTMLKLNNHYSTKSELAALLSHISLWKHCVEIDKPIVILEHDALMIKKFVYHDSTNSIIFLGSTEWLNGILSIIPNLPILGSDGPNHRFICRAHAYSIDPFVAKQMCAHVLKNGFGDYPADLIMRADLFNISHRGLYAYEDTENKTTILNRPKHGRTTERNDNLKW